MIMFLVQGRPTWGVAEPEGKGEPARRGRRRRSSQAGEPQGPPTRDVA